MLASPVEWAFGVTAATMASTALLALPAILGVRRLLSRRLVAPFARGPLELHLVQWAAVLGALGALVTSDALAEAMYAPDAAEMGTLLASFIAPVPLAAVSWMAGEVLSGSSLRPLASFAAAAAGSCLISWALYALLWEGQPRAALTWTTVLVQLPAQLLSSLVAARAYLAVRGEPRASLPDEALLLDAVC